MENYSFESLKKGLSFTDDLLLDSSLILLPKTALIEDSVLKLLAEWNISNVFCNGNLSLGENEDSQKEDITSQEENEKKPKEKTINAIPTMTNLSENIDRLLRKDVTAVIPSHPAVIASDSDTNAGMSSSRIPISPSGIANII